MTLGGDKMLLAPSPDDAEPEKGRNGNKTLLAKKARGVKRSFPPVPAIHDVDPNEHFVEELWVSGRLFVRESFAATILDPCAGFGNVVVAARAFGLEAVGTDLVKRAPFIAGGRDFLSPKYKAPRGPVSIVSNPPFSRMREFVERSLEVSTGKVALLFPSHRTGAARWLRDFPLTRILHVSPRPSLWHGKEYLRRTNAGEKLGNGTRDVAWFIFEPGEAYVGATDWLFRGGEG
jgi:hypothetical protein